MLLRENNKWELYPYKVKYTQHGGEYEQYALPNKKWWEDVEKQWDHTKIVEFIELPLSSEQLNRAEEIKSMPEDFPELYTDYILTGNTEIGEIELPMDHPFRILSLKKENEQLKFTNDLALLGLADTYEKQQENVDMLLNAVAEVYEIILGGVD